MKTSLSLSLLALSLQFSVSAQDLPDWKAKSVETYQGQQSASIEKSSQAISDVAAKGIKGQAAKTRSALQAKPVNDEFWIYDAWVELYTDQDYDGYYYHFSLEFDADTVFSQAEVYARLYLGDAEVFQEYHTSSNFTLYADSSEDSFKVESELLQGFTPDDYEILIELYDAYTDELVAVFDGNQDVDLTYNSLESLDFDQPYVEPVVVISTESGGSFSAGLLLAGLGLLLVRSRKVK